MSERKEMSRRAQRDDLIRRIAAAEERRAILAVVRGFGTGCEIANIVAAINANADKRDARAHKPQKRKEEAAPPKPFVWHCGGVLAHNNNNPAPYDYTAADLNGYGVRILAWFSKADARYVCEIDDPAINIHVTAKRDDRDAGAHACLELARDTLRERAGSD